MILSAKNISLKTPDGRTLLSDLSFELKRGESLLIQGANGTGKTSLLRSVLGMTPTASGTITRHIPREAIAFLPQLQNTSMHLAFTLREVLLTAGRRDQVNHAIETLGLLSPTQLNLSWNCASGGERQKTLLIRALIEEKPLLVVDEPMNHLDLQSQKKASKALAQYIESGTRSLIMVSHQAHDDAAFNNVRSINLEDYAR